MKYFKRLAAAICAVAITLSVAGCADVSTIGSVDNQTINAGIYLLYEQTAIGEAQQEVDDQLKAMGTSASKIENFSYYNYNVQDKTFSQYVQDRTLEQVKEDLTDHDCEGSGELALFGEDWGKWRGIMVEGIIRWI